MKVLITGVAGFIGSNMLDLLLEKTDFEIVGIDNLSAGNKIYNDIIVPSSLKHKERFSFINGNIRNICLAEWCEILENIDIVFHFAATPSVPYSVDNPIETNKNNVSNSLVLLEWCKLNNVKKFVFSSSSSMYGNVKNFPTKETEELSPLSPYALQKKIIEEYCKMYSNLYGIDTVCLRYFNVYGENQYAENAYSTAICAWSKSFAEQTSIRLDGDGTQSRDFVYVKDVCLANYLVGTSEKKFNGEVFNVGSGENVSLLQIKEILENVSEFKPEIIFKPTRVGDVYKTHADISKLKELGFKPSSTTREGVEKTFKWYKEKNGK